MRSLWIIIILSIIALSLFSGCSSDVVSLCPPEEFFSGQVHCLGESMSDMKSDSLVHYDSGPFYGKLLSDDKYFEQVRLYPGNRNKTINSIVFYCDPARKGKNPDTLMSEIMSILQNHFGEDFVILERPSRKLGSGVLIPELPVIVWDLKDNGYIYFTFPPKELFDKYKNNSTYNFMMWMDLYLTFSQRPDKKINSLKKSTKYTRQSLGL